VIYDELVRDVRRDESRAEYRRIAADLEDHGAQGVIAGCTEIELLLGPDDVRGAWFPTTRLHVLAAVDWMLAGDALAGSPNGEDV
jgi:aspartate racemase